MSFGHAVVQSEENKDDNKDNESYDVMYADDFEMATILAFSTAVAISDGTLTNYEGTRGCFFHEVLVHEVYICIMIYTFVIHCFIIKRV